MRKTLLPGEQLICITRPQARRLVRPVLVFLAVLAAMSFAATWAALGNPSRLLSWVPAGAEPYLSLACIAVAVCVLLFHTLRRILAWGSTRYVLTSRRIMVLNGLLARVGRQYSLASVQDVAVRQELLQRPLRSGTITLELRHAGSGVLEDVPEVGRFRSFIQEAIDGLPEEEGFPEGAAEEFRDPASRGNTRWSELREGEV
ncbi:MULTISPECIES: PH domain-containing protein [Arthrobacter]|uniref:PH domain-containing protein n=2 Tax=Arthrobacter TaxID=1663 RepID=A0ABU9KN81_9MICC|nr:PH domain-containing protein [Arthrobacter sp. YJM1]MDP5228337.1 PH domain-containing protein [Arthrobacter sp. YJM1]